MDAAPRTPAPGRQGAGRPAWPPPAGSHCPSLVGVRPPAFVLLKRVLGDAAGDALASTGCLGIFFLVFLLVSNVHRSSVA